METTKIEWTGTMINMGKLTDEQAHSINPKMWNLIEQDIGGDWEKDQTIIHAGFTHNPWWGCEKVSRACVRCYAETFANRYNKKEKLWRGNRRFFGDKHWNNPVRWNTYAEKIGVRLKVFCASMADVFEKRDDLKEHRERLWKLIEATPNLEWLLLTKRPENIRSMVPMIWNAIEYPDNVAIGITVEDQEQADIRMPHLKENPAKVKFMSGEPLTSSLDIDVWEFNWIILGGESGPKAEPTNPVWFTAEIWEAKDKGVPVFFKQWGEWIDAANNVNPNKILKIDIAGGTTEANKNTRLTPEELQAGTRLVSRVGKKQAGNLINGYEKVMQFARYHEERKYISG